MKSDNMGNRSFKDLLEASMKSKDTEEWLDVHFTRHENLCAHMAACLETAAPTTANPSFCETDDDLVDHEAASCDTQADIEP